METITRTVKVDPGAGYEELATSWEEGSGEIKLQQGPNQIWFPIEDWDTLRQIIDDFVAREDAS